MATPPSPSQTKTVVRTFSYLSVIVAILLLVIGGLAMWAHVFTTNMVHTELSAQKIYFPERGSPALDPAIYPDLQQYAGQLVDTPKKAHAYANGFIGRHLASVADGKVYAEVSAASTLDPTNEKLRQQKQTLFQGETLRGVLLTSGYGFGTIGIVAGVAAWASFIGSAALFITAAILRKRA